MRTSLQAAGISVEHTPSHILPVHVGDPALCSALSDSLMRDYGHYVQAINYPTVPKGEEKLRVAPTPHHTTAMMDRFTEDLQQAWLEIGLPLKTGGACSSSCKACSRPQIFNRQEARENCNKPNCPQMVSICSKHRYLCLWY